MIHKSSTVINFKITLNLFSLFKIYTAKEIIKTSLKFLLNIHRASAEAVQCQPYTTEAWV